jgi:hypothetical protein
MAYEKEGNAESGSESWNVAQGYTNLKILKPLVEMDKLVKVALYGSEYIEDYMQLQQNPELLISLRTQALLRFIDILKELDENSDFAMEKEGTKTKLKELAERVKVVEQYIDGITYDEYDARNNSKVTKINEPHFRACLNELREIKKEIPMPLNKNSLIFRGSDEVDLDKLAKQIEESG